VRSADTIKLSVQRRRRLTRLTRRGTAAVREVRRAVILLLAADRRSNEVIAGQAGCDVATVRRTRRDFRVRGMKALRDRPRPGRPLTHDLDVRLLVIATATSEPPQHDAQWTHRAIREHLHTTRGIRISASQIGRILAEADIKPHKVRGWLNRPDDPEFFTQPSRSATSTSTSPPAGYCSASMRRPASRPSPVNTPPGGRAGAARPAASSNTSGTARCR
jgi:transposase